MFDTTRQVPTRIGDLSFDHDYPTNPTVQKLYDEMDFQRACQLYLWALPIVGLARWRQAYRDRFDLGDNEVVLVEHLPGPPRCSDAERVDPVHVRLHQRRPSGRWSSTSRPDW